MKRLVIFLCLFATLLASVPVKAAPTPPRVRKVQVVMLEPTLSREFMEAVVAEARSIYAQRGAPNVRFLRPRRAVDPLAASSIPNIWEQSSARLAFLRASALTRSFRKRGADVVFYSLPLPSDGLYGGRAYQPGHVAMGHLYPQVRGLDFFDRSVTILAHELGHSLGASHIETPTIMNVGALWFTPQPRTWDPFSLFEMRMFSMGR